MKDGVGEGATILDAAAAAAAAASVTATKLENTKRRMDNILLMFLMEDFLGEEDEDEVE